MAESTFVYKGTDKKGKQVQGELSGASTALIKAQLLRQGIRAKSVRKKTKPLFGAGRAIKPLDIAIFTRQLSTMMKAGVPLVQSFEIVADGVDNPRMKDLALEIRDGVASGTGFAATLRHYPKYFDDLFCSLVGSGEQSGALETMLGRIATYKEKTEILKAKIKKAMTYPISVLVVALIVTAILLIKVVPQFAETFSNFGAELPAFTQFVMDISEYVQSTWYVILVGIIATVYIFGQARQRSKKFSDGVDKVTLKLPIIGGIVYNSVIARFARTLSTTFAAGVPLIDALTSASGAAGNAKYRDSILNIRDNVSTGMTMHSCLRSEGIYPSMMIQMTLIGEESGSLDEMLDNVAVFFENEVDNMVDNLTTLLEPMIMAILGVLVGGLMIAMYLPIFLMGSVV